jgi:hypothetical protein
MKKIVVGGQIDKRRIADLVKEIAGDKASVEVKSDIEAAMSIKSGAADLYLGACNTGGGGALAMAIALLGMELCSTVSMPGEIKSDDEIKNEVASGKKAFGFTAQDIEKVVPTILKYVL